MALDWFGRKARSENEILNQRSKSIRILLQNSHLLDAGAEYLKQLADRCNHKLPIEQLLSAVTSDIKLLMAEDRQSGAYQLNPECRPLVLLVEFGYESILLATARLNHHQGRDICEIKAHQVIKGGMSVLERKIIAWLCEKSADQHPNIPLFQNHVEAAPHFEIIARKLMKLTCNGAMDITLNERIVVNGIPVFCSIPFSSKAIYEKFMPLLGEFGALLGLVRKFLNNERVEFESIDRVVCAGILGTIPLLRNTLRTVTSKPVIAPSTWYKSAVFNPEQEPEIPISVPSVRVRVNPYPLLEEQRTKKIQIQLKEDEKRMQELLKSERDKALTAS